MSQLVRGLVEGDEIAEDKIEEEISRAVLGWTGFVADLQKSGFPREHFVALFQFQLNPTPSDRSVAVWKHMSTVACLRTCDNRGATDVGVPRAGPHRYAALVTPIRLATIDATTGVIQYGECSVTLLVYGYRASIGAFLRALL